MSEDHVAQATKKKWVSGFDPVVSAQYEEAAKKYRQTLELLDELRRAGVGRPGFRLVLPHHHGPRRRGEQPAAARGLTPSIRK